MRISDEKIEEVRSASDIVDVISAYVPLKKRGKSYVGRCPFHQEKTPSFTVSAEKQVYHCFGCGAGGNVFGFVMQFEKVSFVEAVRSLAERAGIVIPTGRPDDPASGEYEALYSAARSAGVYFHENLVQTVEGRLGLEYLKHRGLVDETIRKFGLGYSMNGWDGLVKQAQKQGLDLDVLDRAGLLVRRDDGTGFYDRFRGRIMIPIFLPSGRTIAFGARKLREDDPLGKYINSPETPIYNKSAVLYGLSHSKEAIREKIVRDPGGRLPRPPLAVPGRRPECGCLQRHGADTGPGSARRAVCAVGDDRIRRRFGRLQGGDARRRPRAGGGARRECR